MSRVTTQKREEKTGCKGPGLLLSLLMLFYNSSTAVKLFRMVYWADGVCCPYYSELNVTKYCKYGAFRWYFCKD